MDDKSAQLKIKIIYRTKVSVDIEKEHIKFKEFSRRLVITANLLNLRLLIGVLFPMLLASSSLLF